MEVFKQGGWRFMASSSAWTSGLDPNRTVVSDRYRRVLLPSYLERIEQLAGDLFIFLCGGSPKGSKFPQKPGLD